MSREPAGDDVAPVADRRPGPVLIHDGVVVPGALCVDLGILLDLLQAYLRMYPVLPNGRTVRLPRAAEVLYDAIHDAAVDFQERQAAEAAFAVASAQRATVLTPAQTITQSGPEITTEQAATILRKTEARVRQLLAAGSLTGRKIERNVWMINRGSVLAYASKGTGHDHGDSTDQRSDRRGAA